MLLALPEDRAKCFLTGVPRTYTEIRVKVALFFFFFFLKKKKKKKKKKKYYMRTKKKKRPPLSVTASEFEKVGTPTVPLVSAGTLISRRKPCGVFCQATAMGLIRGGSRPCGPRQVADLRFN